MNNRRWERTEAVALLPPHESLRSHKRRAAAERFLAFREVGIDASEPHLLRVRARQRSDHTAHRVTEPRAALGAICRFSRSAALQPCAWR